MPDAVADELSVFVVHDDDLRDVLHDAGVTEIRRWNCLCGCEGYALYGTAPLGAMTDVSRSTLRRHDERPIGPDTERVVWVALAYTFHNEGIRILGSATVEDLTFSGAAARCLSSWRVAGGWTS